MKAFEKVTPEDWQACINHVIKEENDFVENDKFLDELEENDDDWEDLDENVDEDGTSTFIHSVEILQFFCHFVFT